MSCCTLKQAPPLQCSTQCKKTFWKEFSHLADHWSKLPASWGKGNQTQHIVRDCVHRGLWFTSQDNICGTSAGLILSLHSYSIKTHLMLSAKGFFKGRTHKPWSETKIIGQIPWRTSLLEGGWCPPIWPTSGAPSADSLPYAACRGSLSHPAVAFQGVSEATAGEEEASKKVMFCWWSAFCQQIFWWNPSPGALSWPLTKQERSTEELAQPVLSTCPNK